MSDILRKTEVWVNRPDDSWYLELLRQDPKVKNYSDDQCQVIIDGCKREAVRVLSSLVARYGRQPGREYARLLGLSVVHSIEPVMPGFLYLGLYEPDIRTVTISRKALKLVRNYITSHELSDLTPARKLEELVLYHEIFHAIEEMTPGIYTRRPLVEIKHLKGLVSKQVCLDSAGEIGAIHFSRCACQLAFSPCIYSEYLTAGYNEQAEAEFSFAHGSDLKYNDLWNVLEKMER